MTKKTRIGTVITGAFCAALGFTLFDGIQPAEARPDPRISICHYQIEEERFKKLTVGANAWTKHEAHGDFDATGVADCNDLPPPHFAVAYINEDDQSGYDENNDTLIAAIEDTNGTPGLNPGDTVRMGHYPLNLTDCENGIEEYGTFRNVTHTISNVLGASSTGMNVLANGDTTEHLFQNSSNVEGYGEGLTGTSFPMRIVDKLDDSGSFDGIHIHDLSGPSMPDRLVSTGAVVPGDGCHVTVEVNLP